MSDKANNDQRFTKRSFRKRTFSRAKPKTTEEKIKDFILYNSKNGFFTKVPTIERKFEISHDRVWENVGLLLSENVIECIHDERTGDVKLCEMGKSYQILKNDLQRKRTRQKEMQNKTKPVAKK